VGGAVILLLLATVLVAAKALWRAVRGPAAIATYRMVGLSGVMMLVLGKLLDGLARYLPAHAEFLKTISLELRFSEELCELLGSAMLCAVPILFLRGRKSAVTGIPKSG
jgi:hypothetical protein